VLLSVKETLTREGAEKWKREMRNGSLGARVISRTVVRLISRDAKHRLCRSPSFAEGEDAHEIRRVLAPSAQSSPSSSPSVLSQSSPRKQHGLRRRRWASLRRRRTALHERCAESLAHDIRYFASLEIRHSLFAFVRRRRRRTKVHAQTSKLACLRQLLTSINKCC